VKIDMKEKKRRTGAIYEKTDSELYRWLDSLSDKQLGHSENVDTAVDAFLSKRQRLRYVEKRRSADSWLKRARRHVSFDFIKSVPIQKIAAVLISLVILFVAIPSLLPFLYGGFESDVSIVFEPEEVYVGDLMNISVSIPYRYNITSVSVDMSGFDTLLLSIGEKTKEFEVWQSSWLVPDDVAIGSYVAWIDAVDNESRSYSAGKEWRVVSFVDNQTNVSDTDDGDVSSNETVPVGVLNISVDIDKENYRINDTVFVDGFVTFNDSLVNTSVDLRVVGPGVNDSVVLNVTMDGFSYEFVPLVAGDYRVLANVSYRNLTAQNETSFVVKDVDLNLSLWCDKSVYRVGDTVLVEGLVTCNDVGVNASVWLNVSGPGVSDSVLLNASLGVFSYSLVASSVGNFSVSGVVVFENKTAEANVSFEVMAVDEDFDYEIFDVPAVAGRAFDTWSAPENSVGVRSIKWVNHSYFWNVFTGYGEWRLEWYNVSNGEWVDCSDSLVVGRNRSGDDRSEKVSLEFTAPVSGSYCLTFVITLPVLEYVNLSSVYEYWLKYMVGGGETYDVFFNFSDIAGLPGVVCSHGIRRVLGEDLFWFRARRDNIPAGMSVLFDPTFGDTSTSASNDRSITNTIRGGRFTCPNNGQADNISAYLEIPGGYKGSVKFGIYRVSDNTSVGNTSASSSEATGWNTLDIAAGGALEANTDYYLVAWASDSKTVNLYYDANGATGAYESGQTYDGFPASWNPIMEANTNYSIYCSYSLVDPVLSSESPTDTAADQELNPKLSITVSDPQGDTWNITFRTNASGSWADIGSNDTDPPMENGTYSQTPSNMDTYSQKYWWSVNVTDDDGHWTNETYSFTTKADPGPEVYAPITYNSTTGVQQISFVRGDVVWVKTNVTYEGGRSEIDTALINITNTTGAVNVSNVTLTEKSEITVGGDEGYMYHYNYTLPDAAAAGSWTVKVWANDTLDTWNSDNVDFTVVVYGILNITWTTGSGGSDVNCTHTSSRPKGLTQDETFWMNVTIKADGESGATYGDVNVTARTNWSGGSTMKSINTSDEEEYKYPFYVNGSGGNPEGILEGTWYNQSFSESGGVLTYREFIGLTYDSGADRTILFGGSPHGGLNDTWAYNYSTNMWVNRSPSFSGGTLSPRSIQACAELAYDSDMERTILFGGYDGGSVFYNETWVYNYSTNMWVNRSPAVSSGSLTPRTGVMMAYYDSVDRMILFGGYCGVKGGPINETWEYNYSTNTWVNRSPSVSGGSLPEVYDGAMVYDSGADRIILLGGSNPTLSSVYNETWVYCYSNNTWWKRNPSFEGGTLTPRFWHGMVYDSGADRTILFGGNDNTPTPYNLNDTWVYNYSDNTWYNVSFSVDGGSLYPREAFGMAYDSVSGRTVLACGFAESPVNFLNDTWLYNYTGNDEGGGGTNPEQLGELNYGNIRYVNFSINATGTGKWMLDVNVTSDNANVADNDTCNSYVVIGQAVPIQDSHKIWNSTTSTEWTLSESPTDVSLKPTRFNFTIYDPNEDDTMDITLYENNTVPGTWRIVNHSSGLSSGTYTNYTNTSWIDSPSTKYWVSFNLTDGTDWSNETFDFTTAAGVGNNPPQQSDQKIWNSSTVEEWELVDTPPAPSDVTRMPTSFNFTISDADAEDTMDITLYENNTVPGTWRIVNHSSGLSSGTYTNYTNTSWIYSFDTKYNISFNLTDGTDWSNKTFNFTTESEDITIDVTPGTWSQGEVEVGTSNETAADHFTIINDGNVDVVITVNATNATNAIGVVKWYLSETQSKDHFTLQYNKSTDLSWTNINYTYNTFIANLGWGASDTFALKIIMATTSSTTQPLSVNVTFKSVKA